MTDLPPREPAPWATPTAVDYRAIVDALHRAVIVTSPDGVIQSWSRSAERLYGWTEAEVRGKDVHEVLVPLTGRAESEHIVDTVLRGAMWRGDFSVLHRNGRVLRVAELLQPVTDEHGALVALVGVSEDVTEQRLEEQHARQLAEHLALALDAGGLGTWRWDIVTGETIWDAKLVQLFGLQPGEFDGTFDAYTALLHPDDRDHVLAAVDVAVREKSSYVVEHRVVWPDGSVHWLQGKGKAIVDDDGRVVGTMGCVSDVTEAMHAAAELETAITAAVEAAERERLSARRLEFIGKVNDALTRSATRDDVMGNVTRLAVPEMGDFCAIYVLPTPEARTPIARFAHRDAEINTYLERFDGELWVDAAMHSVLGRVMESGESVYLPRVDAAVADGLRVPTEVRELIDRFKFSSAMTVPLVKNRRIIGALQFINTETSRTYTPADVTLAEAVASRVASTMENRRLAEQQREIATTLQASLLPAMLPEIPGVDVAVRYWAAGEGTAVGGDFYDVFGVDKDRWAAVIGDVCGTGPAAAALTGLARHTIRASAWHGATPSEVLGQVNTAVLRCGQRTFCTALYCELVPGRDGVQLTVAAGGHPLPLVRRAGGKCETFGEPGTLLGMIEPSRSTAVDTMLHHGDVVVLYTDGVTDLAPPNALVPDDVCELVNHAIESATTADELAGALGRALEARVPFTQRDDDIAVLVLRIVPVG